MMRASEKCPRLRASPPCPQRHTIVYSHGSPQIRLVSYSGMSFKMGISVESRVDFCELETLTADLRNLVMRRFQKKISANC